MSDNKIVDSRTILSWDVGIKNLAYCMLQKNDSTFKILDWGVINLVDDTQLCQVKLRGGNQCQTAAKYKIIHQDEKLYQEHMDGLCVCEKHKTKIEPKLIEIKKPIQKKSKKQNFYEESIICKECDNNATYKISNIEINYCWCDLHKKRGELFEKKIKAKKLVVTNCAKKPIQSLAEKIVEKLDEHENFMNVNEVIIENQPSLINMTMKTISCFLYMYFVKSGVVDKKNESVIESINFISPSNKLKVNEDNSNNILKKTEKTKVYKKTKELAIAYCEALLSNEWKQHFSEFKKKDDPADAFLAGLKYLFGDDLPEEYAIKLKKINFEDYAKVETKKKSKQTKKTKSNENDENSENIQISDVDKIEKKPKKKLIKEKN